MPLLRPIRICQQWRVSHNTEIKTGLISAAFCRIVSHVDMQRELYEYISHLQHHVASPLTNASWRAAWCGIYDVNKAEHLYSALHGIQTTLKHSGLDHTAFNLQRTPCVPLPHKRSPDGTFTECGGGHLIAAHYSFIDPERMKGWVGLVGWPIADGLPT